MPKSTSVGFSRVNLRNRLLSVILPTVLGTLTLSGFLGYRFLVQEKAQQEIKLQLVNETALAGESVKQLKALLPQSYWEIVASNLSHAGIQQSHVVQIISPDQENVIQTITAQGLSDSLELIGGTDLAKVSALLRNGAQKPQDLGIELQKNYGLKNVKVETYPKEEKLFLASFSTKDRYYTLLPISGQDWVVVTSIDAQELQAVGSEVMPILLPTAIAVAGALTIIIVLLANQISQPLVDLATTAERAAAGDLDIFAQPKGTLETQTLADSFNNLIIQVKKLLQQQQDETLQVRMLRDLILQVNNLDNTEIISETIVEKLQSALNADRVLFYSLAEEQAGIVVAESLSSGYSATLGEVIYPLEVIQELLAQASTHQVQEISNIQEVELSESYRQQLEDLEVKASLTRIIKLGDKTLGFLVVHQCDDFRNWQEREIELFEQVGDQMILALERLDFLNQQKNAEIQAKQAQEQLEKRAWQLLEEVDGLTTGDLTIRAQITDDEIGTIADSYNATIESLHNIVTQVKNVAAEVEKTAATNDSLVQKLTVEAISQTDAITATVGQIQTMTESIHNVSANAVRAEKIVQQASNTIIEGDVAMNQAVAKINGLQTTVLETEQKVKRLGESSQEISQVVNSIGRFAAQTHLLALKASIEAARAGEQGKGFAVIAEEVRSLAAQSATATTDVDNLVARIQLETNEVITAMAEGTQQVVTGTELVQKTRQNLNSITHASQKITQLVKEIAQAASQQAATSDFVRGNITHVAVTAQENSQSATEISHEIEKLLAVAAKLQAGIAKFKT